MRDANSSGLERERQLLAAHDRVREVDLVGDRQVGPVGHVLHPPVLADDLHGRGQRERAREGVLPLEAGGVKEAHEGEGRAVEDRDLGALDLDEAVVQADAGGGRQGVLHGADRDLALLEGGRQVEARGGVQPGRDRAVRMLPPKEDEAIVGGRRMEMRAHRVPRMEAHAVDGDCRFERRLLAHASIYGARSLAVLMPGYLESGDDPAGAEVSLYS